MANDVPPLNEVCFFIAPIGDEGTPERERSDDVLEGIVAPAVRELGLTAVRGDMIGESGQITEQIIDHVLGAKAAVADLTGLNPNVFYELALRHSARRPVALIAEKGQRLPFDISHLRTIFFENKPSSAQRCIREIVTQFRQAFAKGTADSPVAASSYAPAPPADPAAERSITDIAATADQILALQRETHSLVSGFATELRRQGPVPSDPPRPAAASGWTATQPRPAPLRPAGAVYGVASLALDEPVRGRTAPAPDGVAEQPTVRLGPAQVAAVPPPPQSPPVGSADDLPPWVTGVADRGAPGPVGPESFPAGPVATGSSYGAPPASLAPAPADVRYGTPARSFSLAPAPADIPPGAPPGPSAPVPAPDGDPADKPRRPLRDTFVL
jgi:hypothetical protein